MPGRSLRVFLPDGSPSGLRIAELGMSTIKCVVSPRAMLPELATRDEVRGTGIYFLTGPDPSSSARMSVYVGEADNVLERLKEQNRDETKGFWDTAYVFLSKGEELTKAHVRWLEARSVEELRTAKRATVENSSSPNGGVLPEGDRAEMAEFLDQIKLILPMLGFAGFEPAQPAKSAGSQPNEATRFQFSGKGYSATGHLLDGNFVVHAGSRARLEAVPTLPDSSREVREALAANGALELHSEFFLLTQDYAFNSPSQAAEVMCGNSINGRTAWKTADGQTLGQWQDAILDAE